MKQIFTGLIILGAVSALAREPAKPNLLVIMCDDLGYEDVSFNVRAGVKPWIPTPNIDTIASSGAKCASGYVTYPACGPSRAGFIMGRYQDRFGFCGNPTPGHGIPPEEKTIAEALRPVGYQSAIFGKWHLGHVKEKYHPLVRGFDEFYGFLGGAHKFFPEDLTIEDPYEGGDTWMLHNHTPHRPERYLTHEFTDKAIDFIERNQESPFFIFMSYNAPHAPIEAPQEYIDRFSHLPKKNHQVYAGMVSCVDDNVGRLLETLKRLELEADTIIFFLSDNGGKIKKNAASDNGPLRGGKSNPWEGGIRVPYAVQWKGVIPAGTIYDEPVSSLDIFGTIADITGAPENSGRPLDGVNIIPYLTGEKSGVPHDLIFMRKFFYNSWIVRKGDYKVVIDKDAPPELYNLKVDIGETQKMNHEKPEVLLQLLREIKEWNADLMDATFVGSGITKQAKEMDLELPDINED
jgi:arylsulfatase A-like enzyme